MRGEDELGFGEVTFGSIVPEGFVIVFGFIPLVVPTLLLREFNLLLPPGFAEDNCFDREEPDVEPPEVTIVLPAAPTIPLLDDEEPPLTPFPNPPPPSGREEKEGDEDRILLVVPFFIFTCWKRKLLLVPVMLLVLLGVVGRPESAIQITKGDSSGARRPA